MGLFQWMRAAALVIMAGSVSACATDLIRNAGLAKSQNTEFVVPDLVASTTQQNAILMQLQERAGIAPGAQPGATDWDNIIDAGVEYANAKCEAYMGALVRLNRDKKTITSQIGLLGTATAGVMAATQAAARDIALAAVAFGLAGSTVDNLGANVLYEIDPSSVRAMVNTLQANYSNAIKQGYTTRPAAMNVIRSYAALCTPANIEAELNHAIKKAQPTVLVGNPKTGKAPAVTNAQASEEERYGFDGSSQLLDDFIRVDGKIVDAQRIRLEAVMTRIGVDQDVSILKFINNAAYASKRIEALKLLLTNK